MCIEGVTEGERGTGISLSAPLLNDVYVFLK